jgi:mgtE-like transporter
MPIYQMKRIVKESLPPLLCAIPLSIAAGQALYAKESFLLSVPGIFFLLLPFISCIGDLASTLSARVTTALHQGLLEPKLQRSPILLGDIGTTFSVGLMAFTSLGFLTYIISTALNWACLELSRLLLVSIVAGILATLALIVMALLFAFGAFKYGWDPDNVISPILTTTGDFIGISFLIIMLGAVGAY